VPLPYQPENNDIPVQTPPTGFDALRTLAVSRIYLDNFDHITAYWVGMGMKLAQVALRATALPFEEIGQRAGRYDNRCRQ